MTGGRKYTSSIWRWAAATEGRDRQPSPAALADLARRRAMGETRSNTGQILGDPPAGRSALDRKRAAEEAARLAKLMVTGPTGVEPRQIEHLASGATGEGDEA